MHTRLAIGGVLGVVTLAGIVLSAGMLFPRVAAQAAIQVMPVRSGGGTCRDMNNDLSSDRNAWRTPYFNYMAGFMTGANYVSYAVPGRSSNVPVGLPHGVTGYTRADDAVFAVLEKFCAQNPTTNISAAMMKVYSELPTE